MVVGRDSATPRRLVRPVTPRFHKSHKLWDLAQMQISTCVGQRYGDWIVRPSGQRVHVVTMLDKFLRKKLHWITYPFIEISSIFFSYFVVSFAILTEKSLRKLYLVKLRHETRYKLSFCGHRRPCTKCVAWIFEVTLILIAHSDRVYFEV